MHVAKVDKHNVWPPNFHHYTDWDNDRIQDDVIEGLLEKLRQGTSLSWSADYPNTLTLHLDSIL